MADNEESTMSKDQLNDLKKKVLESITNERFQLVTNYPFIGDISLRLDFIPVRDKRLPTAATDGSRIFFDIDFYTKLTEEERCFVLAHETWHCVMLHFLRKQLRDAFIFNIATDMEVNNIIRESCSYFRPPESALFPPSSMTGRSAEELYEYLLDKKDKLQQDSQDSQNNQSGNNSDEDEFSVRPKRSQSNSSSSSKKSKFDKNWDRHTYKDEGVDDKDEEPTDQWGKKGYDPDYNPGVSDDVAEKMREAVIAEAQKQSRRNQGQLPSCIQAIIDNYRKPEIRWQEELARFVTIVYGDKRQWLPPNRRHVHQEIYLQSRRDQRIKVTVAVDTSGSCTQDLPKFFGELQSLLNTFGDYDVDVIYCDATVQKVDHYDRTKSMSTTKFEWKGGGGTSFKPPFEYLVQNHKRPDCFIYFTDGYGDVPERPPAYPVLWLLTSDGSKDFCKWGKKIRFRNDKYKK